MQISYRNLPGPCSENLVQLDFEHEQVGSVQSGHSPKHTAFRLRADCTRDVLSACGFCYDHPVHAHAGRCRKGIACVPSISESRTSHLAQVEASEGRLRRAVSQALNVPESDDQAVAVYEECCQSVRTRAALDYRYRSPLPSNAPEHINLDALFHQVASKIKDSSSATLKYATM
ncbi:hypothetical protein OBBRIDRAFT_218909 [Obba rivulosa]|uniref:Uncharacterized protein n=1 Tax=Obba rivulosa TaxID=1052685 RepID=A0A8E2ANM3_9APHY|nr:hypothetical protein OBBRIDRAFT_218909 [Obba rivulosa]